MDTSLLNTSIQFLLAASPVWLPVVLGMIAYEIFVKFKRKKFFASQQYVLLEIIVPKEVAKSPLAMELFLNTIWQTAGETTWYDRNILGKTRAWFSLEIASIDGFVHFYIWTRTMFQRHVESQIYAQYPGAEIKVAEDYALKIKEFDPSTMTLFGLEYALKKEDPYPIKTYVDYGLDKTIDEEEVKVDPLSQVLELFGQIGKGEQMWLQFICRAHKAATPDREKRKWYAPWTWNALTDNWQDEAKVQVAKIRKATTSKYKDSVTGEEREGFPNPTKGQMDVMTALERSVSKPGFDVGIRSVYVGDKEKTFGPNNIMMVGLLKPYNSGSLNSFKPQNITSFDYPWQDWNNVRVNKLKRDHLYAYKLRSYFFPPVKEKAMVLNSEELATVFHFPGTVVQTPTVARTSSKRGEAPSNLPI